MNIIRFIPQLIRMVYPHWVTVSFFTRGWGFFFAQEIYNLSVLITLALLSQILVFGFSLSCFAFEVALIIAFRRLLAGGICHSTKKLNNKTVVITGANVGIGKETARDMLRRGARVILACRSLDKAEDARREIYREGGKVEVRQLDLSSLASVRKFASGIVKDNIQIHILINNAGVMMCPYTETEEGHELQMGTNHLGHFLLTNLLLPQMKHGEPARIVNLTSLAHCSGDIDFEDFNYSKGYDKQIAYANSKIANVLFTRQLANILKGSNIEVFSVHPGVVFTALARHLFDNVFSNHFLPLVFKTAAEGAQTSIYCATEATQSDEMYFSDCAVAWPLSTTKDDKIAEKLWNTSEKLIASK